MLLIESKKKFYQALLDKNTHNQNIICRTVLTAAWLETSLGPMVAIASEAALYLLEFVECKGLEREIECLLKKTNSTIVSGHTPVIASIENELKAYFNGSLQKFETPLIPLGTPFQRQVWDALIKIPFGETRSYLEIAQAIGKPTAYRAVAQANGANQLALLIPCHRIIQNNGALGGYAGGIALKQWLIHHEKSAARRQPY